MQITVNGECKSLTHSINLIQLLEDLHLENRRVAIEVNQIIVPRGEFSEYCLQEGDNIEIVHAIGGG